MLADFTTNYFECLDVPLTNGLNVITIHATDLAGDTTTTNFNFTLDYSSKTNPPVVQITWPQDGGANPAATSRYRLDKRSNGDNHDPTGSDQGSGHQCVVFTPIFLLAG